MSVGINVFEFVDRTKSFLSDYDPDMKSLKYNYSTKMSEIKVRINVPTNRSRHAGEIRIPAEGYRIKEMVTPTFHEVTDTVWEQDSDEWVLDPTELPDHDLYLVTLEGKVEDKVLDRVVSVDTPEDPMKQDGLHQYWLQSRIEDPATFEDIWDDLRVDGVHLTVNVGVHQCFATAIPDRVTRVFRRTSKTLRAMNENDFRSAWEEYRKRKGSEEALTMSQGEASALIRSLASAEKIRDYIDVERPFRRQNIDAETYEQSVLPEEVEVDVETELSFNQPAAKGYLAFRNDDYTEFLKDEADELTD